AHLGAGVALAAAVQVRRAPRRRSSAARSRAHEGEREPTARWPAQGDRATSVRPSRPYHRDSDTMRRATSRMSSAEIPDDPTDHRVDPIETRRERLLDAAVEAERAT